MSMTHKRCCRAVLIGGVLLACRPTAAPVPPVPAAPDCGVAGARFAEQVVAPTSAADQAQRLIAVTTETVRSLCIEDVWSDDVRRCVVAPPVADGPMPTVESCFSPAQADRLEQRLTERVAPLLQQSEEPSSNQPPPAVDAITE